MKKRFRKFEDIEEPSVNLTPLIDVVFTILIMFIVIAPLLELDRVELADANGDVSSKAVSVKETGPIAIHVHRDNTVWLNQQKVEIASLPQLLKTKKQQHPKARPQLYQDRQAHFGIYQSVKNAAESAGFEEIDVILKPA